MKISVCGGIFSECSCVDKLTAVIPLDRVGYDYNTAVEAACMFRALKVCLDNLGKYYDKVISDETIMPRILNGEFSHLINSIIWVCGHCRPTEMVTDQKVASKGFRLDLAWDLINSTAEDVVLLASSNVSDAGKCSTTTTTTTITPTTLTSSTCTNVPTPVLTCPGCGHKNCGADNGNGNGKHCVVTNTCTLTTTTCVTPSPPPPPPSACCELPAPQNVAKDVLLIHYAFNGILKKGVYISSTSLFVNSHSLVSIF
ncbi:5752_t:CDS:2 [Paraglomus brasilianum]|uniref:5752_t:CDS:1 n=1 Tax=Paraglomus brasilianum TaxID=144538 RepID=A0A9N9GWW8_9GLOM|nr:5752_t:CDS:2 [Paraglomus brasilianum]